MLKIGKKYWHPEFGYVTYEGMDKARGMYHIIGIHDEGITTYTTLDSTTLLFNQDQRRNYERMQKVRGGNLNTVQTGKF
jgi:hypothetical protein